jgi:hypothetical protein
MNRIVGGVLVLVLAVPALWAEGDSKDKPATPAQQYQALVKEYNDAEQAFEKQYRQAKTDEERHKLEEKAPRGDTLAPKFLALAEKNPKDAVAVDALVWIVQNAEEKGKESPRGRALAILGRDHPTDLKVVNLCDWMMYTNDPESGDFLRAVLEKNSDKQSRGRACMALAMHLENRLNGRGGKDLETGRKEVEETLERAIKDFGDVQAPRQGKIGEQAKKQLNNFRLVSVGVEVPTAEGTDQDGKKFKLSEYPGKVVLLDFWGNW